MGPRFPFDASKIEAAVNAASEAVNGDEDIGEEITREVVSYLEIFFADSKSIPDVEQIQDLVEKVLIEKGYAEVAKAYILYREQHKKLRDTRQLFDDAIDAMNDYLEREDWKVTRTAIWAFRSRASITSSPRR